MAYITISKKKFHIYILLSLITNSLFAQNKLDKNEWQLVYNQNFSNITVADFLYTGATTRAIQKEWIMGFSSSYGEPVNLFINGCHIEGQDANPSCNSVIDTNQIKITTIPNPSGDNKFKKNGDDICLLLDAAKTKRIDTPWQVSAISSLHDDFPALPGVPGYVYGMFEIRCKLPRSYYSYTSFWLSGSGWPPEVDAFESCIGWDPDLNSMGAANVFFSSLHWGENSHPLGASRFFNYQNADTDDLYNTFHTWTIVWTPNEITWFFDGKEYMTDKDTAHLPKPYVKDSLTEYDCMSFFRWERMHMILSHTLSWPNTNDSTITFDPFIIDYIKVFRPKGYRPLSTEDSYKNYFLFLQDLYSPSKLSFRSKQKFLKRVFEPKHLKAIHKAA